MVSALPFSLMNLCFSTKLVELFRIQMLAVDERFLRDVQIVCVLRRIESQGGDGILLMSCPSIHADFPSAVETCSMISSINVSKRPQREVIVLQPQNPEGIDGGAQFYLFD